jgi:hypothetical protein
MPEKLESDSTDTVRVNITVSKDLDKRFRATVAQTIGFKKGNLQVAIEEALNDWIEMKTIEETKKRK